MSEIVFSEVPFFNGERRPTYPVSDRIYHHLRFCKNISGAMVGDELIKIAFKDKWLDGTQILADYMSKNGIFQVVTLGPQDLFYEYLKVAFLVQMALLLSDFMYHSIHVVQHKIRWLYKITDHGYHHTFRFPLGEAGPWLSLGDIIVSGAFTFTFPGVLSISIAQGCGLLGKQIGCYGALIDIYINEMNHSDHCGKQLPTWSGCPFLPPLGFALGLHESIPIHEAHHNFGTCGFGLLGIADKCFGTVGYPVGHPKSKKSA